MSNPDDTDATEASQPLMPESRPPTAPTASASSPGAAPPPPPPPPVFFPSTLPAGDPGGVPPRTSSRSEHGSRGRSLAALALACFLTFAAAIGYAIGANHATDTTSASGTSRFPSYDPNTGLPSSGNSSGRGQQANVDVRAIADKVNPSVANLVSVTNGGQGAGTAIVISPSGLALTNNHVIAGSTELQAEVGGDGKYHDVRVLGYSIEDDVALVQIQGVSGLTAASLGTSSSVQVGDVVVALGNAGGRGGDPTVVSGTVTALDQEITAADQDGSHAETLEHLIQIDANIQPGDSGGPLVDAGGKVIGMNAAASRGNGGFGFGGSSTNEGYAIPVEDALAIAKKIQSGSGSATVHVGAHAGVLGVAVSDDSTANGYGDPFGGNRDFGGPASRGSSAGNGAYVEEVQAGSGADDAGIQSGDVIVGVNDTTITSSQQLTHTMVQYKPGDDVRVRWIDRSGASHTDTIELGSGPPA